MKPDRLTLVAVAVITLAALVGAVVLTALGYAVPELLPFVVTAGVGMLGGAAVPRSSTSSGTGDGPVTGAPASASVPTMTPMERHAHGANRSAGPTALVRRDTGNLLHPRSA